MGLGRKVEHGRWPVVREHLRHRVVVGDVRAYERDARILQRRFEIQQAARVRQLVDNNQAIGGVLERVVNEVGADEPGATRDEKS